MDDHKSQIVPADVAITNPEPEPTKSIDFETVFHAIVDKNLTPEILREVLTIKRDFDREERAFSAKQAFTQALVGLKGDLPPVIAHDRNVNFLQTQFTYTTLAQLVQVVTPIMCRHGFTHKWIPSYDGGKEVGITCELEHVGGHAVTAYLPSIPSDKKGMNNAQAVMATQTTLKRNTLLSLLGLATADMDDTPPEEEAAPSSIDGNANIAAATDIRKRGLDVADAEKLVGCQMPDWTKDHLGEIWRWVQSKSKQQPEPKQDQRDPFD